MANLIVSIYSSLTGKKIIFFIYYILTIQVLKVCRTPGPTACLKLLHYKRSVIAEKSL